MADNRNNRMPRNKKQSEHYDIDGNTVKKSSRSRNTYKDRTTSLQLDEEHRTTKESSPIKRYTFFTIGVSAVTFGVLIALAISVTKLNEKKASVDALKSDLQEVKEQTAILREDLNTTMNLQDIFNCAVDSLGMSLARKDQIIYYDSANDDYVHQYESIPNN